RAVRSLRAGLALDEAHGLPSGDVDGGEQLEAGHRWSFTVAIQWDSNAAPASPDFSGWNWVAARGPFSTAATNGPPCSAHVTRGGAKREASTVSASGNVRAA